MSQELFYNFSFWIISLFNEMLLWAKHINGTGFLAFVACQRQLTACKEHVAVVDTYNV